MKSWPQMKTSNKLKEVFSSEEEWHYWHSHWDKVSIDHSLTAWDFQWMYTCIVNGGLSILPRCNLVANIGFGDGAVNSLDQDSNIANILAQDICQTITHPIYVLQDRQMDRELFSRVYAVEHKMSINMLRQWSLKTYFTSKGIVHKLSLGNLGRSSDLLT